MSLEIKEESCKICKAYLFSEDDIAVCPVCGAPHHRECFVNAGHCGMEEFHGTDKQYDIVKKNIKENKEQKEIYKPQEAEKGQVLVVCSSCHNQYPISNRSCPNCGTANGLGKNIVMGFDMYGGVNPEEDLGQGHKAKDIKEFLAVNFRFIQMFARFKKGAKVIFSLWHLFFPAESFAMRKMYPHAFVVGAFNVASSLLMIPLSLLMGELIKNSDIKNYYQMAEYLTANMTSEIKANLILAFVGFAVFSIVRIICALFGNRMYYKHVLKSITEIKATAKDEEQRNLLYRKKGGGNFFAFIITYMIIYWLPNLIMAFIM